LGWIKSHLGVKYEWNIDGKKEDRSVNLSMDKYANEIIAMYEKKNGEVNEKNSPGYVNNTLVQNKGEN